MSETKTVRFRTGAVALAERRDSSLLSTWREVVVFVNSITGVFVNLINIAVPPASGARVAAVRIRSRSRCFRAKREQFQGFFEI